MHDLRRTTASIILTIVASVVLSAAAFGEPHASLDADVRVDAEGRIHVGERLDFDLEAERFEALERRLRERVEDAPNRRVIVREVTDGHGEPVRYRVSRRSGLVRVRFDAGREGFTGRASRQLSYVVEGATADEGDVDRLVLAFTNDVWGVPIARTRVQVDLPPGSGSEGVSAACRIAPIGNVSRRCTVSRSGTRVSARTTAALDRGEGLELTITLPAGVIRRPGLAARFLMWFRRYITGWVLVPIMMGAWMITVWTGYGRDPRVQAPTEARQEPPSGLSPAEVGTVWDESADIEDLTATVLDLAVRGHIRLVEADEPAAFLGLDASDYRLEWTGPAPDSADLLPYERELVDALFGLGTGCLASDLRYAFNRRIPRLQDGIYARLDEHAGAFVSNPAAVRSRYQALGALWFVAAVVFAAAFQSVAAAAWFSVSGVIVIGMARAMPARTARGRALLDEIVAFRAYLRAEGAALAESHPDPAALFERFLPFAYVIGAGDDWATAMRDAYRAPPPWFVPRQDEFAFSSRRAVTEIGRCLGTLTRAMAAKAPRGAK